MFFKLRKIFFESLAIYTLIFFISVSVFAQEMKSSNYSIKSDSINIGGLNSASNNYKEESTLGEIATGKSESSSYKIFAGYQQMQQVYLALTPPSNVSLTPNIGGISGGVSNGSTSFIVTTDSEAGYSVSIKASSSPALNSFSDSFADYTPVGGIPDFSFSINSNDSEFAFTVEGDDIADRYKDLGGVCNQGAGGDTSDACWDALSTSPVTIVLRNSSNHPSGTESTLKFRAQSGTSHFQSEGVYNATTTITVIAL